jgi:hypothetical protein
MAINILLASLIKMNLKIFINYLVFLHCVINEADFPKMGNINSVIPGMPNVNVD